MKLPGARKWCLIFAAVVMAIFALRTVAPAEPDKSAPANFAVQKTEEQWRKQLTAEQYQVLRQKGTETPFVNKYDHLFKPGTYQCAACGNELFRSDEKFDSHCGWPAFSKSSGSHSVIFRDDKTLGMERVEVICARCGSHLGHVFNDGPAPTGQRYCINSVSLQFAPKQTNLVKKAVH